MPTAEEIIDVLNLKPLEGEGGFFRRSWTLPSDSGPPRATAIFYLMTPDSFSALHRLYADEVFHFYLGDPCEQFVISEQGEVTSTILGHDLLAGQQVQSAVPKGLWQGTRLLEGGEWALLGTTMTPGFYEDGFQLATSGDLKSLSTEVAAMATGYLADGA